MMAKPKYFVSYSREDKDFVLRLVNRLRDAQVNVWLDQSGIGVGEPWDTTVQDALEKCDGVIIVLSPHSVKSKNVLDEIGFAEGINKTLIPIVYKRCILPLRLVRLNYIDLTGDKAEELEELTKRLRLGKTLTEIARAGPYAPTMSFSVEDVLDILSLAPRNLVKQLLAASFWGGWLYRLVFTSILKGLHPFYIWSSWGFLLIFMGFLVFPSEVRGVAPFWILGYSICLIVIYISNGKLKRLRAQMLGEILAPVLPHRSPSESGAQRMKELWARMEPIMWEISALPADSWGEYVQIIRVDEDLRHQVGLLLSIFGFSLQSREEFHQIKT